MATAQKVMKSGRGVVHIIEIPLRGETRWYRQNTQPIRDSTGKINAILSISSDITKSKEAEEELRKYRNDLECLIKERTAELEKKNAELERMNRLFVGREFRIKELKNRIRELEKNR
jgi:chromosome segregation ATPase